MLKWEVENNVISRLYYNGCNIIKPWGFETADSSAFFSLEKGVGYRHTKRHESYSWSDTTYSAEITTIMQEGSWALSIEDHIENNRIVRQCETLILEDSFLMDYVLRFRFPKSLVTSAEIYDRVFFHENSNVYHQFPTDRVLLKCTEFEIAISVIESRVPANMEPVIYVRDSYDEWVVHIRMIPRVPDKEVIKICTAWAGTRPLPQWLSRIVLSSRHLREHLWHKGERKPYRSWLVRKFLNPAAFGMVRVGKGEKLKWNVQMEIL